MSSKARFEEHHGQPFLVQATPGFLESVQDPETPESLMMKHESVLKEELSRILAQLPPKEAEAITKWLHGMTQAQIASQDGVTQAAISIRAKRGLEKLFAMRDSGQLGTLEFVWKGLHKLQDHINHEIDLERDGGSETSLPLGDELGDELGEHFVPSDPEDNVYIAAKQALVMHELSRKPACPECALESGEHKLSCSTWKGATKPKRRAPRKSNDDSGFNGKEAAVLAAIKDAGGTLHLKDIERAAQSRVAAEIAADYSDKSRNSWLRNSLRKLRRKGLVMKLGKGMYAPCQIQ